MPISGADSFDRLVLDTSGYSHLRTGHAQVLRVLAQAAVVLLPVVVIGELEAAFEGGNRAAMNRAGLAEFLSEPYVVTVDVNESVAHRYGELFALLRRNGTPISVNDVWIAAVTLDTGSHLLTFDQDFKHVPNLRATVLTP